jgi:hypothetical protein
MEDEACLGLFKDSLAVRFDDKGYKPTGVCADGYYGALCSACMPGYFKQTGFICRPCGNKAYNIIRLVGITILATVGLTLLIRSTIAG